MAGSASITGRQHYVLGIGHPVTEAETEAPTAIYALDESGNVTGLVGPDGVGVTLSRKYPAIDAISGVVAFWDFSEPRAPYYSKAGAGLFPLVNGSGSRITKSNGGPLGNSIVLNGSTDYLVLPAESVGDLNLGGRGINTCFVLAFVKRSNQNPGFVAGCWQEDNGDPRRQYGLFVDLGTYGGEEKVCFHVSKTGGASPGLPYSRDYSANKSAEPGPDWVCVSGSYDGSFARSYIEGRFEPYSDYTEPGAPNGEGLTYNKNPYAFSLGLNSVDCDFTVGACKLTAGMGNFYGGEIAAILVMDRAPSAAEIAEIQNAINPAGAGFKNRLFQFNQVVTGVSALTDCKSFLGATATDNSTSVTGTHLRTNTGSPGQGFVYRASTSGAGVGLFTCENLPEGLSTANIATLAFQLANGNTGDSVRFCLKIDSSWYATEATYAVSAASSSGADWSLAETKTITFAKTAALWRDLTLVPGSTLSLAGSARVSALPDGSITGWGIWTPGTPTGNVRFRNFEVTTL